MRTHRRSHFIPICLLLCGSLSGQKIWTLSECIDTALEQNIQIQQTAIQEQIAENTIDARWGGLFPQLNASAGYNWNFGLNIDPVTNVPSRAERQTNSLSLNASWTLFNGLQNYNNLAQARLDRMVSVYQMEDMKNNTALSVASQYVQILLNQEILKIADEQARVTQLQLRRMKQLVDAGARPKGDQLQLEAQRARDEQSFVSAQNNLRISRLILAQTMQIPNGEDLEVAGYAAADPESGLLSTSPQDIYTAALGNQPSIKAMSSAYKVRRREWPWPKAPCGRAFRSSLQWLPTIPTKYSISIRKRATRCPLEQPLQVNWSTTWADLLSRPTE